MVEGLEQGAEYIISAQRVAEITVKSQNKYNSFLLLGKISITAYRVF